MVRNFLLSLLMILLSGCLSIGGKPVFQDDGVAINGYDPVAYFVQEKPVKGSAQHRMNFNGATWYFSSADNLQKFKQDPQKYLPQYGGYCAYGMSNNFVVSSDPLAFTLHDNKLYLNYSFSVRDTWRKDIPGYVESADQNWIDKTTEN